MQRILDRMYVCAHMLSEMKADISALNSHVRFQPFLPRHSFDLSLVQSSRKRPRMTWSNAVVGTNESLAKAKYACLKQRSWLYWSLTAVYTPCGHQIFMGCNLSQKLALPFYTDGYMDA